MLPGQSPQNAGGRPAADGRGGRGGGPRRPGGERGGAPAGGPVGSRSNSRSRGDGAPVRPSIGD